MKIAHAKIDVFNGTLIMEFDREVVNFNIFEAMRYPFDLNAYFAVNDLDSLMQKFLEMEKTDALDLVLVASLNAKHDDLGETNREDILDVATALDATPFLGKRYTIFWFRV